ncbi:hypothetical protein PENTCL1PPCAC_22951 [Pristionchus entomophagus]|uniref:Uncharacterized protein n=1 Tax=Pristionchus entomophagus TaxID=358040 RepID=A0AAV5U2W7_9BILA|nr:hypothetical protein PENTCL1PPCAC_22951 [Pristionchus entomophagus]
MVLFRLLLLSPPLLLIFSRLVNSLDSTQQLLNSIDSPQDSNDTLMEGSGGEGSGFTPMSPLSLNDDLSSTLTLDRSIESTTSMDIGSLRSRFLSVVDKRATEPTNHKLGNLPIDFLGKMDLRSTNGIAPSALMAMGRPLKKGQGRTENEYVALLTFSNQCHLSLQSSSRRWGRLFLNSSRIPQAEFIDNNRVVDARSSGLPFRSILLPSNAASTYNVGVSWIQGRLVDPLSIVVQTDTRRSYPKITAGVFVNSDYEYLGEADVENRRFTYVENGHVAVVEGNQFDESVFVMTKESCSCSCQSKGGSIFANIKDFFG